MTIIDGKAVAKLVQQRVADQAARSRERGIIPTLAVIIVGEDPASQVYVRNKERACEKCAIRSIKYALPAQTTESELLALVEKLNADRDIHGILCQLPLPKHISEQRVIRSIDYKKDVDGFNPVNAGRVMSGDVLFAPCTPAGVMTLLAEYGIDVRGKNCVVLGRSNIVGKPMAMLLLHAHGTVTMCHSRTQNLPEICAGADILVAAIGKPKFVTADFVKEGAVVIDVGINRLDDGKLCGDVDFDAVKDRCSFITPVPGGVGVMTIAMLMSNTLLAASLICDNE